MKTLRNRPPKNAADVVDRAALNRAVELANQPPS
jgi:hypothetical protein